MALLFFCNNFDLDDNFDLDFEDNFDDNFDLNLKTDNLPTLKQVFTIKCSLNLIT